jgi:hypothetical protein
MDSVRATLLRNKSDVCMILLIKKMSILEKIPDTSQDIFSDRGPVVFVEEYSETIKARSFGGS